MSHRYQEPNYEDDVEVEDIPPFAPPELWQGIDNAFNHRRNRLIPSAVDKPNRAGIWIERFMSRDWVQWEWKVLVVGQRMRGLLAQAITDRWPRFFRYSNANDYIVDFPVTAALRLAAGQTTNRDVIDFCLSSQGLLLQPISEMLADSSGLTYITSKILTTKQGKDWFSGTAGQRRGVVKTVRPWEYDYVFDPLELRSNPVNPNAPEFLLFPASLDGENIAQGILITLIQTIRAVDQVPPPPPGEGPRTMSDFGIPPTAKEEYLHDKLFPKNLKWWWNLWMNAEYHSWKDALYYMIYKERLDVGEQAQAARQFREMVDRTRGMRLAGWMASS
ncbi:hypothetical protein QFC21_006608 [Naganishia friedmannii]|uniref:Uncharacterized protein n=1 Tax=Naganishia friedmannii TaxID=89922 RepID=A0ACC2V232_9TREE|nr:hypothetical protein QFC21_006608 [Naganishia friedmannii]